MSAVPRQGDLGSVGVRRRPQQVSRRNCLSISSSVGCVGVVGAWRLRLASVHHGDSTAVEVGDVVEKKKLPRAPTNERASDIVGIRLDLDVAGRESRGEEQESVAGFPSVEVDDRPGNEFVAREDGLWFAVVHNALSVTQGYHTPESVGRLVREVRC